jgi:flagellar biosynthetic protein FlhB
MSENESGQERTEQATGRKRGQAHEDGRVPRSQELTGATILLAGAAALGTIGGSALTAHMLKVIRSDAAWLSAGPMSPSVATVMVGTVVRSTLLALIPFLMVVAGAALAINLIQARGVISFEPLMPDLARIDPLGGFRRIFGLDAVANLVKSLLKLSVLGFITWKVLHTAWPQSLDLVAGGTTQDVLKVTVSLALRIAFTTGFAYLALSLADYAYQIWQFERTLMMTRQEVVQEHKEQEGNPLVKSRIRALQKQQARKRMLTKVTSADVVVINPIHIAVALKYDPEVSPAPVVVAMGERLLAERIKQIAKAAGVPLMENIPLARALLATAKVGKSIPPALYVAVAEVIAFVYRQQGRNPLGRREARS